MSVVTEESPAREVTQVEDQEEILPDGTVHHVHRERTSSFKNVKKCVKTDDGQVRVVEERKEEVAGSLKENLVETFDEPPKPYHEERDIKEVLADGRKVHKHVVLNRLVRHSHTHQESFDSDHGRQEEDYDVDEVVPGTESAFVVNEEDDESSSSVDGDDVGGAAASGGGGNGATETSGVPKQ